MLTQTPCFGAALWLYRFEWNHMIWFSQSQRLCSKLRNDVLDLVTQSACVAYSLSLCVYVWLCHATTSEWSRLMTNKDGTLHPHADSFLQTEGIWNNYVDIQQKIMQVRFNIFLSTWGYNSLGDPTRQHEVWRKILLNTNSSYLTEAFESMHVIVYTIPSD